MVDPASGCRPTAMHLKLGGDVSKFPPMLGLTLPLDWRERQARGDLPDVPGGVYAFIGGLGFGYVEFGAGTDDDAVALLTQEAELCRQAGLRVAVHLRPPREEHRRAGWFGDAPGAQPGVEPVLHAGRVASKGAGSPVHVVLHPAEFVREEGDPVPEDLRPDLLRRSQLFFSELERRLSEEPGGPVRVMVEHQLPPVPGDGFVRIGDTSAELLDVVRDCGLPLCWDTGHYLLSIDCYGLPLEPPAGFLPRVSHVHLHDVVDGRDHKPISGSSDRLRELMRMLQSAGFSGWVTLEYALAGIAAAGGPARVLPESVRILSSWAV